ncbi:DUF7453 family protein [Wenzhouxiangella marina]|uniref:Uncharacterized protein n=1 Tax=Wenzhouxiangella marina TaxID=1579979 RepID=A0A0K0XV18_9GAMM|nr:choice-of-anchor tandem repeat NxxGxxAF-containing protein [Wenzhouxiangella marina]AKS41510.1 hypothetical protein WM2015_1136 [Wenzhouxiangella marina]MBB6086731.1 hypothetical protein [Wenzhouxiangella marina]
MRPRLLMLGLISTFGLASAVLAQSADYRFVRVTPFEPLDTPVPTSIYGPPSLNDMGSVAFTTQRGTDRAVVISDGSTLTTIADTAGPFTAFAQPALNESSQVSFRLILDAGPDAVAFGSAGSISTIAAANSPYDAFGNVTSINNQGTVAFFADIGPNGSTIMTYDGSAFSAIEDETGPFGFFGAADINSGGQVAYLAVADEIVDGVRLRALRFFDGSSASTIADNSGVFSSIGGISLNDSGEIAYVGNRGLEGNELYLFDGLSSQLIATGAGPIAQFGTPALNDAGLIAFSAALDDGRSTINVWQEGTIREIVGTGDTLEGKTIISPSSGLGFVRGGLNDKGAIAFLAVFTDETSAIYRADPVEVFSDRFELNEVARN